MDSVKACTCMLTGVLAVIGALLGNMSSESPSSACNDVFLSRRSGESVH
jgi:hypothetical protein